MLKYWYSTAKVLAKKQDSLTLFRGLLELSNEPQKILKGSSNNSHAEPVIYSTVKAFPVRVALALLGNYCGNGAMLVHCDQIKFLSTGRFQQPAAASRP
jgi:hypothetical protein